MSIYNFPPTYLYLKRHQITGKLYFGKTTKNPQKYLGSGKHWVNHIKLHGKENVETLWYQLFFDENICVNFALSYSRLHNIVESKEYLNLREENGLDGASPYIMSDKHKLSISLNWDASGMRRKNMKENNPMFHTKNKKRMIENNPMMNKHSRYKLKKAKQTYQYHTPYACFNSLTDAAAELSISVSSIKYRCVTGNNKIIHKNSGDNIQQDWLGLTWNGAGWFRT